jgi:hypothetical protein
MVKFIAKHGIIQKIFRFKFMLFISFIFFLFACAYSPKIGNNFNLHLNSSFADANWFDTSWQYRSSITVDNTLNSSALNNYQVKIDLNG